MPRADLSVLTTLRLGGPADRLIRAETDAAVIEAVREADSAGTPLLVLGGGSNVVIGDGGFPGTVVLIATSGISGTGTTGDVDVAAGESWDRFAAWAVAERLAGIECLCGIPGLVGATPVQNVGAYGQEVAALIRSVRVYDRAEGREVVMNPRECGFGYRTSVFKRATGRYVVLGVSFGLRQSELSEPIRYAELAGRLGVAQGDRAPLDVVRKTVLDLRRGKGMVLDPEDPDSRSAGSFFTNPVLSRGEYAEVARRAGLGDGEVPHYLAGQGAVKVPAAWLIERAGFGKGYPGEGPVRISAKHTLALTTRPGATTADLLALARQIRDGVRDRFGVALVPEPVLIGADL